MRVAIGIRATVARVNRKQRMVAARRCPRVAGAVASVVPSSGPAGTGWCIAVPSPLTSVLKFGRD
jgi:hypothetical protein